jgi:hypothetical protein
VRRRGSFFASRRNSVAVATSARIANPRAAIVTSRTRWQHGITLKPERKSSSSHVQSAAVSAGGYTCRDRQKLGSKTLKSTDM